MIKKIQIKNAQGTVTGTYDVGQIDAEFATKLTNHIQTTTKEGKGENVSITGDNNVNIEPREAVGTGEGKATIGTANRKGGNISLKPGDDIELCSHHRGTSKINEVAVKVIDGSDNPVKLQVFAGDITLSTKGKNKTKTKDENGDDTSTALYDDPNVMNVNVTTGDGKGYLKVRAQAIDLRCEDHGGIALQPKGVDGQGHMNKIKFEHGGGDGLEFGTFNAEKTSIFTDEYRFNKNGIWKMATRTTEASDKIDANDATTNLKYVKAADDFYDNISSSDSVATTEQIINTAAAFNRSGVSTDGNTIAVKGGYRVYYIDANQLISGSDYPSGLLSNDYPDYLYIDSNRYNNVPFKQGGIYTMSEIYAALGVNDNRYDLAFSCVIAISRVAPPNVNNTKILTFHPVTAVTVPVERIVRTAKMYSDIETLVDYFKTGDGKSQGPWAND